MTKPRLRIIHETNPQKYFPALFLLTKRSDVSLVGAHRYSVFKEWLRSGLKDRAPLMKRSRNALSDLLFRVKSITVSGETIIMGFAPWDWRLLIYRNLARRNRIIYHTSWHDWRLDHTPRQPRPTAFRIWLRDKWINFLGHPNVDIVAVTPHVAQAVEDVTGQRAHVIPHAVPEAFFKAAEKRVALRRATPLKLLFVGEVSPKKGISILTSILPSLADQAVLTVVGNGVLANNLSRNPVVGVNYLGPIYDRNRLAAIMAEHDVLVLPSQRESGWEELFGIVLVEALAAGMAVLASNHVGPRGILKPALGAGLIDQNNHVGFAKAISELAADRTKLTTLRNAQSKVAHAYDIEQIAQAWKGLLDT